MNWTAKALPGNQFHWQKMVLDRSPLKLVKHQPSGQLPLLTPRLAYGGKLWSQQTA